MYTYKSLEINESMLCISRIPGEILFKCIRMYSGWAIGVSKNKSTRSQERKQDTMLESYMLLLIIKFVLRSSDAGEVASSS